MTNKEKKGKEEKITIYHSPRCPALNGESCNCHEPNPSIYVWSKEELEAEAIRKTLSINKSK